MKDNDPFEKFIKEHREEFDSELPADKVWENITNKLAADTKSIRYSWVWKAAAILFFGLSTYLFIDKNINETISKYTSSEQGQFENTEAYYNSMISVRKGELEIYISKDSPFYLEFSTDITELDSIYSQLKEEYDCNQEDIVMEAMIKNLQLRIEIMDRQLQVIQKVQKLTNNKNKDEVVI